MSVALGMVMDESRQICQLHDHSSIFIRQSNFMRKGMIQCLTFKLLYFILYFNDVTIKESVRKKVTKHDICHHEMWVGVVNTMDKDNTKECLSWRRDGMGQDMSYTSPKLQYISLQVNSFYILLEIPDFCLKYLFRIEPFI